VTISAAQTVSLTSDSNDINLSTASGSTTITSGGAVTLNFGYLLTLSNNFSSGAFYLDGNGFLWWSNIGTGCNTQLSFS
jgi:hypothetical protein